MGTNNIDVNKCKYRDKYTNFCLAERNEIGDTYTLCTGTDCYFKQLARKTQDEQSLLNVIDDLQQQKNKFEADYNDLGQDYDQLKVRAEELQRKYDYYKRIVDGCPEVCENGFCQIDFENTRLIAENEKYEEKIGIIGDICTCSKSPMNCEICPMCYECEELCVNGENIQDIILRVINGVKE